jgi:hypothetical protein
LGPFSAGRSPIHPFACVLQPISDFGVENSEFRVENSEFGVEDSGIGVEIEQVITRN